MLKAEAEGITPQDLIARKLTSPEHLGIEGGSNGGLLMGVMLTERPDLFKAVVCQVPLLDMRRFNKLLAGASWMDEYGNPDKPQDWAYISKYSPYQNVSKDKQYSHVLFTTSTRDDRTGSLLTVILILIFIVIWFKCFPLTVRPEIKIKIKSRITKKRGTPYVVPYNL